MVCKERYKFNSYKTRPPYKIQFYHNDYAKYPIFSATLQHYSLKKYTVITKASCLKHSFQF